MADAVASYDCRMDFDRDGYFNDPNVLPTDPLNLIPTPVLWSKIPYAPCFTGGGSATLTLAAENNPNFGTKALTVVASGTNAGVILFGTGFATTATFAVTPGATYTLAFYMKYNSTTGNTNVDIDVTDTGASLVRQTFALTTSYAQYTVTFTVGLFRFINLLAFRANDANALTFELVAPFLVAGSSIPLAFNAGSASNAYDVVSSYVENYNIQWGIQQYTESFAQPSRMSITLNNTRGLFSPENSASPLAGVFSRGAWVRVQASTHLGQQNILYQGTISSIQVLPGTDGLRRVTVQVSDPTAMMFNTPYTAPLLTSVTTDQVIQRVFDDGAVVYPYPGLYWMLDTPGSSELDQTTTLFSAMATTFETGDSSFSFAGDITDQGLQTNVANYIREYVYGELGGRFFYDPTVMQYRFFKRSHSVDFSTASAITPVAIELEDPPTYVFGDDVLNDFTVGYYPRSLGAAASVLATLSNLPLQISAGQSYTTNLRFSDATVKTATVAAKVTVPLFRGFDYIANSAANGSGTDKTAMITVTPVYHATSADVTIVNGDAGAVYLTTLQLRGTPITAYVRETVEARDGQSMAAYGYFPRTLDLPALDSASLAAAYANFLVQRYKTAIGRFQTVAMNANRSDTAVSQTLNMTVGTYVKIVDSFVQNQTQYYLVTAIEHRINPIASHLVKLTLEPLDRNIYWILDDATFSVLGTTTFLSL